MLATRLAPLYKGRDALSKQHGVLLVAKAGSNAMLATGAEGCHVSDWGIVILFLFFTIPPYCYAIHLPLHKGGLYLIKIVCFTFTHQCYSVKP